MLVCGSCGVEGKGGEGREGDERGNVVGGIICLI